MDAVDIINGLIGVDKSELSDLQRRVQLVMMFDCECMNGGWQQYLYNSSGNDAEEFRTLADQLGYSGIASGLKLIADRMGGSIPTVRVERFEKLKGLLSEDEEEQITELINHDVDDLFNDNCQFVEENMDKLC